MHNQQLIHRCQARPAYLIILHLLLQGVQVVRGQLLNQQDQLLLACAQQVKHVLTRQGVQPWLQGVRLRLDRQTDLLFL